MAKEIHEQPEVVGDTLAHYIDMINERVALPTEVALRLDEVEARLNFGLRYCFLCGAGRQILV